MANKKISELTAAATLTGAEQIPVVQSAATVRTTVTAFSSLYAALAGPFAPSLTGAVSATRYVGGTADIAPIAGTFAVGDFVISQTAKIWICTVAGTPGTWVEAAVDLTSAQTVGGVKTFSSAPVVPSNSFPESAVTNLTTDLAAKAALAGPFAPSITGATTATRYVGGTATVAPTSGTFAQGDFVISQNGKIWICTVAGTPGTWIEADSAAYAAIAGPFAPSITGATTATRYVGGTATIAPTSGTFDTGDFVISQNGKIWICTVGGSPGTWIEADSTAYAAIAGPFAPSITGAVSATRYVGGTATVAPTTGTFAVGDFAISQNGKIWICTGAGTPGTWIEADSTAYAAITHATTHLVGGTDAISDSNTQTFTTAGGTWTKPTGARQVQIIAMAGGGGGGSGRKGAAGTVRCGGGAGAACSRVEKIFPADQLPASLTIVVGTGGTGGAAVSASDTDGNDGNNGNTTTLTGTSFLLHAKAGALGSGGTNATGTGGSATAAAWGGGTPAGTVSASVTGGAGAASQSMYMPSAGGSGGGITTGNAASAGGAGSSDLSSGYHAGGTAGAINSAGGTGVAGSTILPAAAGLGGTGGGGGGSSTSTNAGAGGDGGAFGAGGGGGGAAVNAVGNSGKGGDGAAGIVYIITYF